jgi:hypothetical protein
MRRSARRRPALSFLALLLLLCELPARGFALDLIEEVSKARAKELGISVRQTPRANDVWVQVEFKPTDPKKPFKYTILDVTRAGKPLVSTNIMPWKSGTDTLGFDFTIDPAALPDASVTIVVWEDPITGHGYRLRMKDFIPPAAAR